MIGEERAPIQTPWDKGHGTEKETRGRP